MCDIHINNNSVVVIYYILFYLQTTYYIPYISQIRSVQQIIKYNTISTII